MGLLAHQKEIVKAIKGSYITSVSAPRQSGKTHSAVAAATELRGRTLFVSPGFRAAKNALALAESALEGVSGVKSRSSNGEISITWYHGSINFLSYGRNAARGLTADTLIFDDSDEVSSDVLADFYPAIMTAEEPKIVALGIAPDRGLAANIFERADAKLRWCGLDEETANPAVPELISVQQLRRMKEIVPADVYRRECLGLVPSDIANMVGKVTAAQLHGQRVGEHA